MTFTGLIIPGAFYSSKSDGWYAPGRETLLQSSPIATSRTNPTRGTYSPDSNQYAGLLPGWTPKMLTNVYPTGSLKYIQIKTGGVYRNMIFWGQVQMQSPNMATFINCAFLGFDPSTGVQSTDQGAIKCFGDGYYQWTATDCLIDPLLWIDPTLTRPGNAAPVSLDVWRASTRRNVGIHGGRYTLQRSEIKNVIDTLAPVAAQTAGYENTFILAEDNWLHKNHYYRNYAVMPNLPEGTHSDGIQPAVGSHMTFRGNYIGGVRDCEGYGPNYCNGGVGLINNDQTFGWNSGDDPWNNGVYMAQESPSNWSNPAYTLDYIIFDGNFFETGGYGINHHYETTRPAPMTNSAITNNFFIRKANTKYIIRTSQYAALYSGNRIIDKLPNNQFTIGELVTIKNG